MNEKIPRQNRVPQAHIDWNSQLGSKSAKLEAAAYRWHNTLLVVQRKNDGGSVHLQFKGPKSASSHSLSVVSGRPNLSHGVCCLSNCKASFLCCSWQKQCTSRNLSKVMHQYLGWQSNPCKSNAVVLGHRPPQDDMHGVNNIVFKSRHKAVLYTFMTSFCLSVYLLSIRIDRALVWMSQQHNSAGSHHQSQRCSANHTSDGRNLLGWPLGLHWLVALAWTVHYATQL